MLNLKGDYMMKHRYEVVGINLSGNNFKSECIDIDIIAAIKLYREIHYSVHSITRLEQVSANAHIGIFVIKE